MLIFLHICLFLMPCDIDNTNLASETIVLYNHIKQSVQRDVFVTSLSKFDF